MKGNVLVAIPEEALRSQVMRELAAHRLVPYEAPDLAQGMAMLGRADFSSIIVGESKHALSLKGFCLLARKRHPAARIFITLSPSRAPGTPPPHVGVGETCFAPGLAPVVLARQVSDAPALPGPNPFDIPTTTTVWNTLEDAAAEARGAAPRHHAPTTAPTKILQPNIAPAPVAPAPRHTPPPAPAWQPPSNQVPVTKPIRVEQPPRVELPPMIHTPAEPMPMPETSIVDTGAQFAPEPVVLMTGDFDEMGGPALLMTLLAQQLTGRLSIQSGPAEGNLFMYRGEPVWAEDPMGDGGLFVRLVQRGALRPGTRRPEVSEGQLVASLVRDGALRAEEAQQCMLGIVKERVSMLASQRSGTWQLLEDREFLTTAPLFKVNSFGLLLEAHKRNLTSSQIGTARGKLAQRMVAAAPALGAAADLIRPFVRGQDLARILKAPMPVEDLWNVLQLDQIAGALLVLTLMDARLVTLSMQPPAPPPQPLIVTAPRASEDNFDVPDTQVIEEPSIRPAEQDQAIQEEEILRMYLRLKPVRSARQLLGVDPSADEMAIRSAYHALVASLNPSRIPRGPRQELLLSYVNELRRKADLALKTLLPRG